jgi:uncharacterized protein (DUF362 family)
MKRRGFLKASAAAAAGAVLPWRLLADGGSVPAVLVVHGTDVARMVEAGLKRLGGWAAFVKPGGRVVLKPNAAWASLPEQGGNTHPDLVGAVAAACRAAGASDVVVPEVPCAPEEQAFTRSGIAAAVKQAGGRMYRPGKQDFRAVEIPDGVTLREADVVADVLDAPCLINMPVAKSHGGATLTLSMKNWMGSVRDRGAWHRAGLHQCIADFSTRVRPSLVVIDATRIMLTRGPRGPGELAHPRQILFSRDPVAADAYAATLFDKEPFAIPYIRMAHDLGVGCGDLSGVKVEHVRV